jgi:hypothetical protein
LRKLSTAKRQSLSFAAKIFWHKILNLVTMKSINLWAVLVSGVASTAFGFLWFMVLFREPFIQGSARTKAQLDAGPSGASASVMQLAGSIVMVYVLAWLMTQTGNTSIAQGLKLAFLVWLGFVACVTGPNFAFQAYPFYFFLIITGYTLVCLLMSGTILGAWK